MSIYYYSAYDLLFQSELMLPLVPADTTEAIAVSIHYGAVSAAGLPHPAVRSLLSQATEEQFWLNIPSVARFLVSHGMSITIDPVAGIDEDSIRAFLLSVCIEALLRQRRLMIMPGYAVQCGDYAVAFAGALGAGQSMVQGLFYKLGKTFLAGNFFALNNKGMLLPGSAHLEFWPEVCSALALPLEKARTVRPGIEKYVFPLTKDQYCHAPLPLKVIYLWKMHQAEGISFSEVAAEEKEQYLRQLLYAPFSTVEYPLDDTQFIYIHVPSIALKIQHLFMAIERDMLARGTCHA